MERFCGVLIEHFAGKFPTWLSPTQVHIITISEKHSDYANEIASKMRDSGIRVEVDDSDATIGKKIRSHRKMNPAYMVIVGDGEMENGTVSIRARNGNQSADVALDSFIANICEEIDDKVAVPSLVTE